MSTLAEHSIKTLPLMAEQAHESPAQDSVFIITARQLKEIVAEAIQPLQAEVQDLKVTVARQQEEIAALTTTQDLHAENQFIQLQLINNLQGHKKQTVNHEHRIEILRSLLAAHGGKMLTKEAPRKMDKGAFSRLVDSMDEYVETKPYSLNRRQTILILKSRNR